MLADAVHETRLHLLNTGSASDWIFVISESIKANIIRGREGEVYAVDTVVK